MKKAQEKKYLIYKHTSPNGKSYIGQTNDYKTRCYNHQNINRCKAFYAAIKKHGWENFKHEILATGLTLHSANHFEQFYIKHFNTLSPNGYNLRTGGDSSLPSESTKQKMSEWQKGEKAYWYGKKGENHPNFGKKFSEETRLRQSLSRKKSNNVIYKKADTHYMYGKKHSPETIQKMSDVKKGKKLSDETKNKLSILKSGENHHMYGKKGELNPNYGKTGELSKLSKKYIILFSDKTIQVVIGITNYCKNNKLSHSLMLSVANGKRISYKGMSCFHYSDEKYQELLELYPQ